MSPNRGRDNAKNRPEDEPTRVTFRLRFSPHTYERLRAYAVASGFGTRWAIALESILVLALPILKDRKITGKPPVYKKNREENESHSARLMPNIMTQYKMLALTHGYTYDSDLIEEVVEDFLDDLSSLRKKPNLKKE